MKPLSRWASAVYNLLCWFRRKFGQAFPSVAKLAEMLGCSPRTVKRATRELALAGRIWKNPRYRRSTVYSLTPPEGEQQVFEFAESPRRVEGWSNPMRGAQSLPEAIPAPERVCEPSRIGSESHVRKPGGGRLNAGPSRLSCPRLGPAVVNPSLRSQRREVLSTDERVERHHQDDAALAETVRKAAGFEHLSESDRRYVAELERSGIAAETIEAGVLLGRARRLVSQSNGKAPGEIRGARYFAATIAEATAGLPAGYAEHLRRFVGRARRERSA
jgi:hypothetical protein